MKSFLQCKTVATEFAQHKATEALREKAKMPFDLTEPTHLTPERVKNYVVSGAGWKLLLATERVDEPVLEDLWQLVSESKALDKMRAMQAGEVINKIEGFESENRAVLHTAMRDLFDSPESGEWAVKAAHLASIENDKLENFCKDIDAKAAFSNLVLVGIGGSDLGPRSIYYALEAYSKPGRKLHFISNVDPDDAYGVLEGLDLKKTLVAVVSKSGTTIETLTNEELVRKVFSDAGLKPEEHFIAVTGQGSEMDNPQRYRHVFYMWDYVGGRYSSTSMVGGVPLAFCLGFDQWKEFLRGASAMDKVALKPSIKENLPLMAALLGIWNHNFLGYATQAVIPYSQPLHRFPAHLQQCDMESNGKGIDRQGNFVDFSTGPVIWGEPGTNAQHSFFQLIHQGRDVVPVEFIGFKTSQRGQDFVFQDSDSQEKLLSNLIAQTIALATGQANENPGKFFPGNRPSRVLFAEKLTPYSVGALLSYFEHKVAFQGFIWNINSFDQEGVQLGKVLAKRVLGCYQSKKGKGSAEAFPVADAYIQEFETI